MENQDPQAGSHKNVTQLNFTHPTVANVYPRDYRCEPRPRVNPVWTEEEHRVVATEYVKLTHDPKARFLEHIEMAWQAQLILPENRQMGARQIERGTTEEERNQLRRNVGSAIFKKLKVWVLAHPAGTVLTPAMVVHSDLEDADYEFQELHDDKDQTILLLIAEDHSALRASLNRFVDNKFTFAVYGTNSLAAFSRKYADVIAHSHVQVTVSRPSMMKAGKAYFIAQSVCQFVDDKSGCLVTVKNSRLSGVRFLQSNQKASSLLLEAKYNFSMEFTPGPRDDVLAVYPPPPINEQPFLKASTT